MERPGRCHALLALLALLTACGQAQASDLPAFGNPGRGEIALRQYACVTCHAIPGMVDAEGRAGPALDGLAFRAYIAGLLPNTPENLVRWIRAPQRVLPGGAMPDLGVTEQDARDMAAYLYRPR